MLSQCLKISFSGTLPKNFLEEVISKHAKKLDIEGTAQVVAGNVHLIICGPKDRVDMFLDAMHKGLAKAASTHLEIEPFLKTKDYRGVFRIIE